MINWDSVDVSITIHVNVSNWDCFGVGGLLMSQLLADASTIFADAFDIDSRSHQRFDYAEPNDCAKDDKRHQAPPVFCFLIE